MTQITLWSRELAGGFPGTPTGLERVAVTYFTTAVPPRTVLLPLDFYREATDAELSANPRLQLYPKDQAAQDAELQAIRQDYDRAVAAAPPTFHLP